MDLTALTQHLKCELKQADASRELNQKNPEPRPYRNPAEERMRWQKKPDNKDAGTAPFLKIKIKTSDISDESHCCKIPFEELHPINLCDMKIPLIHRGKYLVCRVLENPYLVDGVHALIQDTKGDVEEVTFNNFLYEQNNLEWINPGTVFVIKEPRLQYDTQKNTPSIKIDSPTDVIFVDSADEEFLNKISASQWYVSISKDAEVWREKSNECYRSGDYEKALFLYDRAIRCNQDLAVLYLNKAIACLKTGAFYMGFEAAKLGLEKGGNREKSLYTMAQAAYGMREWQNAANYFAEVLEEFPTNIAAREQLDRSLIRLVEQEEGVFNLKSMLDESKKEKPVLNVADYKGPIEVANIPGKGRGIIATKDIKKGTLLAVSKSFASGYKMDSSEILSTINISRNQVNTPAQTLLFLRIIQNLKNDPHRAKEIYDLYSGEEDTVKNNDEEIPFGVIDAGRIQKICSLNSFGSKAEEEKVKTCVNSDSHLFILPSYFNHSCLANAHPTFYDDVMVIHSTTNIKKGDEIYLLYCSPLLEYKTRKEKLKKWKFECQCELCEIDSKDEYSSQRYQIIEEFVKYSKYSKNSPEEVIKEGEATLEKIRETYKERNKYLIHLAKILIIFSSICFGYGFHEMSLKYLEEVITLVDDRLKRPMMIENVYVNLVHCYYSLGTVNKVPKMISKAFDLCFCDDIDHFKMLYPEFKNTKLVLA